MLDRIGDDKRLILFDGVSAERLRPRGFRRIHPLPGFEPLPIAVDQRDQDDGHLQREARKPGDPIERLLRPRIENIEAVQRREASIFTFRDKTFHAALTVTIQY